MLDICLQLSPAVFNSDYVHLQSHNTDDTDVTVPGDQGSGGHEHQRLFHKSNASHEQAC